MPMKIDQELCKGCEICCEACPKGAIYMQDMKAFIDQEKCSSCQICIVVCPIGAIQFDNSVAVKNSENPVGIKISSPCTTTETYLSSHSSRRNNSHEPISQYVFSQLLGFLGGVLRNRFLNSNYMKTVSKVHDSVPNHTYRKRRRRHGRV